MKTQILFLMTVLFWMASSQAVTQLDCLLTERYNDQKLEVPVQIPVEKGVAFYQKATTRDQQIQFVVYYSQELASLGVRVNDNELGITSSSYIDPQAEKGLAKIRHIRNKPETQLFAIDCSWK